MRRRRVGIWGVFGRGNYGNEATLQAILGRLDLTRFEPIILTEAPAEASRIHGAAAVSPGRPVHTQSRSRLVRVMSTGANRLAFLLGTLSAVLRLDAVMVGGSGGLENLGLASFGSLFEIWCCAVACWMQGKPFLLLNVGTENPSPRMARFFVRSSAKLATYRAYRDSASRAKVEMSGFPAAVHDRVATDLVFSLYPTLADQRDDRTVIVGVMDYWGPNPSAVGSTVHDGYRDRCIQLVRILIGRGWRVRLIGGDDHDSAMAVSIGEAVPQAEVVAAGTPSELTELLSSASVVAGTRYHTLVTALIALTPTVSIGYAEKHRAVLDQFGFSGQHRDAATFDPVEVANLVESVAGQAGATRPRIQRAVADAKATLDEQWPEVVEALQARRGAHANRREESSSTGSGASSKSATLNEQNRRATRARGSSINSITK